MMKSKMSWFCLILAAQTSFAESGVDLYRMGQYTQALPLLQNDSANGLSHYYLGRMYLHGYAVSKDNAAAIKEIQLAAEKGVIQAQQFMGRYALLEENNPTQALYWFKKAADAGDVQAQMYCAAAYIFGFGVAKNTDVAKRYYIPAARSGNALAQYAIAESFLETRQLANKKLGLLWLTKAVAQGNPAAQVMLAKLYMQGGLVEKNNEQAQAMLTAAAAQNYVPAWSVMGEYYLQQKDVEHAKEWLMKGAQFNDAACQMGLANMYGDEKSAIYDPKTSFLWTLKAAQNNSTNAQLALAQMYKSGKGVEADQTLAAQWTTAAKNAYKRANHMQEALHWLTLNKSEQWTQTVYRVKGILHDWTNARFLQEKQANPAPQMTLVTRAWLYQPRFVMLRPNEIPISDYYQALVASQPASSNRVIDFPREKVTLTGPSSMQEPSKKPEKQDTTFIFKGEAPWYAKVADNESHDKSAKPASWLDKLSQRAILGDTNAQYELGQRYQYGIGVTPNRNEAIRYYRMATMQHDLRAQYQLAALYLNDPELSSNRQQGLDALTDAAFKGHPMSQYVLAQMHEQGYSNGAAKWSKNAEQAIAIYELAALNHNGPAQYRLAELLVREQPKDRSMAGLQQRQALIQQLYAGAANAGVSQAKLPLAFYDAMDAQAEKRQQAFTSATQLAEAGDANAALLLGMMYDRGLATKSDAVKAYAWYQKASQTPVSTFILGTYLTQGKEVTEERLAVGQILLQKSANAGFMYAFYNLAILKEQKHENFIPDLEKAMQAGQSAAGILLADYYVSHENSPEKLQQARQIYQQLATHGDPNSQLKLAYLCEQGLGGAQDLQAAGQWYLAAAQQNQPLAQYLLGRFYQLGGVNQQPDMQIAHQWYAKASANYAPAAVADGFMAETMDDDYAQAFKAYQQAAQLGDPVGQYDLGLMYEQGKGIPFNAEQAMALYQQSAAQGYAPAAIRLSAVK